MIAIEKIGKIGKKILDFLMGRHRHTPSQTIVLGFLAVILLGTLLLILPFSSASGKFTDPLTALFTATSATCVTGLSVVTTAAHWSAIGQAIILILIQIGGLGFMSMAVLASLLIRRTITPREHFLVSESLGIGSADGAATSFMALIAIGTFSIEGLGAILLSFRMIPLYGVGKGIWYSVFHSISAFCNAGFDILGENSVAPFSGDPAVLLTLSGLIIVGGIGFAVWADILALLTPGKKRATVSGILRGIVGRRDRMSVYTKFILIVTAILLVLGTGLTLLTEWDAALAGMSVPDKLLSAFFHSVSLRTAGFSSFDNGTLSDTGKAISAVFMLIGGASGSTAGGLKVGTVAILLFATWRLAMGNGEVILFRRRINKTLILRAMTLVNIGLIFVGLSTLLLTLLGGVSPIDCLYEAASAYATVGLSAAGTAIFGIPERLLLIVLMFMGRVGILTITYSLVIKNARKHALLGYPDTNFLVG